MGSAVSRSVERAGVPGRLAASCVGVSGAQLTSDPECCDGSDEWATGACPNRCAEVAKEYRERTEREAKLRKTGGKIRSTYVNFAGKERQRLEDELKAKRAELTDKEAELSAAQGELSY